MIPDEAVEAALAALGTAYGDDAYCKEREYVITVLESAAPHMLDQSPPVTEGPSEGADAVTGFPRAAYRKRRMA